MNPREIKKVNKQLTRGLLDIIVLELLRSEPMHGYRIITAIRRNFGIYFGPSTIYPFLNELQDKGFIRSMWDTNHDRPRKVFHLTAEGGNVLNGIEQSFSTICTRLNGLGMNRIPTFRAKNTLTDKFGLINGCK